MATVPGSLSPFRAWIAASRPRTLPAAAAPVFLAVAIVYHDTGMWIPGAAGLCLLFALLIQIGTNFSNDYEDFRKGTDNEDRIGPNRAVQSGWIPPEVMKRAVLLTFGAAFLVGSLLLIYTGPWIFLLGILCILSGYAYTGGPYPLGYHGWGDLFSLVFFGLVAVGATYYIQTGILPWAALWTGLAVGGLTTNLLVVNNHRDYETDRAAGKNTLAVRWGRSFTLLEYRLWAMVAVFWAPVMIEGWGYSNWLFLSWAGFPLALASSWKLRRAETREEFGQILKSTSIALIFFAIGGTVGLLLKG